MLSARRTLLSVLLASLVAIPLAAQDIREINAPERSGFWWGIGGGGANAQYQCPDCGAPDPDPEAFPMVSLQVGLTANPNLAFGVGVNGGTKKKGFYNSSDITESVGDVDLSAYYYPVGDGNIWIQAGVGVSVWQATQGSSDNHYTGGALILGAGYDFRTGRTLSFTPTIRVVAGGDGDVKDQDGNVVSTNQIRVSYLQAGISMVWH